MRAWVVVMCLAAAPALGQQVYKCTEGGVTTYAQKPCGEKAKPVDLNVHHPDRQEQILARQRALVDKLDARVVDIEHAQQREQLDFERRIDALRRSGKEAAFKAKCDGYQESARNAYYESTRKAYEAKHFSECYGEH